MDVGLTVGFARTFMLPRADPRCCRSRAPRRLHAMWLLRYLRALRDCAVPFAFFDTLPLCRRWFRHRVSKRAWRLAFEGATFPHPGLCLRCALGTGQKRKFCQRVTSAANDLSAYTRQPCLDSCMKALVAFRRSPLVRVKPHWSSRK